MKKLLCFLLMLGAVAQAQTALFYEGFEDVPSAAPLTVPGWSVSGWAAMDDGFGAVTARSGGKFGYCAGSKYVSNRQAQLPTYDNSSVALLERGLNLQGYRAATLKFWYRIPNIEATFDKFIVRIGNTDVLNVSANVGSWTQGTVDLAPYIGGEHTLKFLFTSDGSVTAAGAFLDDIEVVGTPNLEQTVFGPQDPGLTPSVPTVTQIDRATLVNETFNYVSQKTRQVSLVSPGLMVIQQGNPNGLFEAYFNGSTNIKNIEIIAETLEIHSPLVVKGGNVKIYARNLKFVGSGRITTTPVENGTRAADATGVGTANKGQNGVAGLNAGNIDVFAANYSAPDASLRFVLVGGKGQAAGRGRHGQDGSIISSNATLTYTVDNIFTSSTQTYTPPAGYRITGFRPSVSGGSMGDVWSFGTGNHPTDGQDAWQPGSPGAGGVGGNLRTNLTTLPNNAVNLTGGSAGLIGSPASQGSHTSQITCEGGNPGSPLNSILIGATHNSFTTTITFEELGRKTSLRGNSFPVFSASEGSNGNRTTTGSRWEWMNPVVLRQIINKARDQYLQNNFNGAATVLRDYEGILTSYRTSSAWATAPFRLELGQMHDEMRILLQQMANGLDYFGNPNGWVPMLSFEVTSQLFDQEINRSLDIIYLARWITTKQNDAAAAVSALSTARNELAEEIADAQTKYTAANATLASLQGEAVAITQEVTNLQLELESKDNQLTARAVQLAQPPAWEVALRVGLKTAGTICKMIPVYQPALGTVGDVANVGSNFNPDQPWSTITSGLDVASNGLRAQAAQAATDQANEISNASLNPTQLAAANATSARTTKLNNMANASSALSGGIADISSYMEATKAPKEKIDAELEKLKSADPTYGTLVNQITAITEKRRDYADRLNSAVLAVATHSDVITRNLLAMEALSKSIGNSAKVIDAAANTHLKDMERRAMDRLLKYHYFMAKAYEYRLVRRYTGTLNIQPLFDSISSIATAPTANSDGSITDGQRNTLRSVFKAIIADTTETIIDDYNSNPSVTGSSTNIQLNATEIAALNRGESLTLNLMNRGIFLPNEEDVRIVNIQAFPTNGIQTTAATSYGSPAFVELFIEHSGISNIKLGGDVFQFRHYNQSTRNAITWTSKYEPITASLATVPPSPNGSLLRSLVPTLTDTTAQLYSRPSAWADLKVWRAGNNGGVTFGEGTTNPPILLSNVTLQVTYDRKFRANSPAVKNLEVVAAREGSPFPLPDDSLLVDFGVSRADRNGRQNAQGRFLRLYDSSSTPVIITAPAAFGTQRFVKWADASGITISTNVAQSVTPNTDIKLFAIYEQATPTITSALAASGAVENFFEYQIIATNSPTFYSVTGLPSGLFVNSFNQIVGRARVGGTFSVSLAASNAFGPGEAVTLTLTISGTGTTGGATQLTGSSGQHIELTYPAAVARWFRWVAPSNGQLTVDTFGSLFDTYLEIYRGTDAQQLTLITFNDDSNVTGSVLQSRVNLSVTQGTTYWFAVDGFNAFAIDAANGFRLNYLFSNGADYLITTAPNSLTIVDQSGFSDELVITQPGAGQMLVSAAGRSFSINGAVPTNNNSGNLPTTGQNNFITVDSGGGDDLIRFGALSELPQLNINGGGGNDTVRFEGNLTFNIIGGLQVYLQDDAPSPGADSIVFNHNVQVTSSFFGGITLECSRDIILRGGAKVETTNGVLSVRANQQEVPTTGNFHGVLVEGGAALRSGAGDLFVAGRGGNDAGGFQFGVNIQGGGRIAGNLYVEVQGQGGGGNGIVNRSVSLDGLNAEISSGDSVFIGGSASPEGSAFGIGLSVINGGFISAPNVLVRAVGNGTPSSGANFGMEVGGPGSRIVSSSYIQLSGIGGPNGGPGIKLANNGLIQAPDVYLLPSSLEIDSTSSINGSSSVTFQTPLPTMQMQVGANSGANVLGLPDATLDRITTAKLTFADYFQPIQLIESITRSAGNVSIDARLGVIASSLGSDMQLPGTFEIFSASLNMPISSSVPDSGYPQVRVDGNFRLFPDLVTLDLSATTHLGEIGEQLLIVDNRGTAPISGTFAGLPQGATIPWPSNSTLKASISYTGGDGNDIMLTLEPVSGYATWTATNVLPGQDASFSGDANSDGISNGAAYVFGNERTRMPAPGTLTAPSVSLPADVNVFLEKTENLNHWTPLVSWIDGNAPLFEPGVSQNENEIIDANNAPNGKVFYRFRLELK